MKVSLMLIAVLVLAANAVSAFPTEHGTQGCNNCVVCETCCKTVDCNEALSCGCQRKPPKEHQCPEGFTWNGSVCMQDYSSQIRVQSPCRCVCVRH